MQLVYFAWIREKIGKKEEEISLNENIKTVAQLLDMLENKGDNYRDALAKRELICVALDKMMSSHDASLIGVRELALFPPMTGG